jgi:dipeptidyl aminopeptidase/acylaminoacyl peptidase
LLFNMVDDPMTRKALVALLLFASSSALAQTAVPTRQVGTARLENIPAIPTDVQEAVQRFQNYREARFSDWLPNGSMLVTTRFGATTQVHHVAAPGAMRTQLTFYQEPVADAKAVPGKERFLLSRDTGGDEWFQLFVRALVGSAEQLTETGTRNQSPVFSKDGRLVAWSRAMKGSSDYAIMIADPADSKSRRVAWQGTGSVAPTDISPDGRHILVTRNISNRETQLLIVDVASGQARELAWSKLRPTRYEDPRFGGNGRTLIAITNAGSDVRRLVDIEIDTGWATAISPALQWDVESYDRSADGQSLAYAVNEEGFSRLFIHNRASRQTKPIEGLPRGVLTGLGFSPDGKRLAVSLSTANSAGDVWAVETGAGTLTRWTRSELGEIDPARLSEPQLVRFKSFDGLSVPAFVYNPKDRRAGNRTPVIIDIHGGPESQSRPGWNPGAQYFAEVLGATVILPNVRGSDGYGTRYLNLDNGPLRENSVRDIGALLDWIAAQPNLDPFRVAVYGQSYGGYMSLASMIHFSDRLVGGVERYGISDFQTFLKNTEAYRRDNRRAEYGDERDPAMRAVFERISPLARVSRITKPMLVMQGSNDPRVPQSESDQVVAGIRAKGVPVGYVVFSDEGHGFLKKHNNDLRREVETVFLRQLFENK